VDVLLGLHTNVYAAACKYSKIDSRAYIAGISKEKSYLKETIKS